MELESSLQDRVYYAARDGMSITLYAILAEQSAAERQSLLAAKTRGDSGQLSPPLVIASKNGHDKVVHTLLSQFKPDLTQTGSVKFGNFLIEDASALWVAAGSGHLKIVKMLVKAGADVNQATKIKSTPLRAACFEGRLDIVRYLIEHGADMNLANKYNNSCLMIAAYKNRLDVVKYLIEQSVEQNGDLDRAANCGATALHFSAECGNEDVVEALSDAGASCHLKNDAGLTPLMAAAERCQDGVVKLLLARHKLPRIEQILAYELLGASFANEKEHLDLDKAFKYFKTALYLRDGATGDLPEGSSETLLKPELDPIPAYDNVREFRNLEELEIARGSNDAMYMQCLAVRERILGPENPEVPEPVIYRGAVYADSSEYDRCIRLWLHALRLRQNVRASQRKDILRFAQVFCQMINVQVHINYSYLKELFEAVAKEIKTNVEKLAQPNFVGEELETVEDDLECNMHSFLYFIVIYMKVEESLSELQQFELKSIIFNTVKLEPTLPGSGSSLLHMACYSNTRVDDFHTNDVVSFPSLEAVKLLIETGAEVNAVDKLRNSPLHLIVRYERTVSDFYTLHSIITALIENGAHDDSVNKAGQTPLTAATTGVAEIIMKSSLKINLKCLAANSIGKYNLSYQGKIPENLAKFVQLHIP